MSKTAAAPTDPPLGAAHEPPDAPGTELIKRVPLPPAVAKYVLSDDEIRRTWRLASSLAAAGIHKKVDGKMTPEAAFALILIGQDLGISATRALATLDIVKGNVQMRGVLLLSFVRGSATYDYRIVDLDGETEADSRDLAERESKQRATIRFFEVLPDGTKEPLHPDITYTMAMARKTGNVKDGSAWMSARRNMLLWRAASDGVKFHCPDLLGGIPIYTEADDFPDPPAMIGDGQGDGQPAGLDLGPEVEKVIARATDLGHAALADRATIELQLGDQPPAKVVEWVRAANRELDEMPQDAEVVEPDGRSIGQITQDECDSIDAAETTADEPASASGDGDDEPPRKAEPSHAPRDPDAIERMRDQANELLNFADAMDAEGNADAAEKARSDADDLMAEVEAASDPNQMGLGL